MGRLRERQHAQYIEAGRARAPIQHQHADSVKAGWQSYPILLAFLFAPPDSDAIAMLDARGEYFDIRTGDTWDLFFPGYYRSTASPSSEIAFGACPVGKNYTGDWYFGAEDFDGLCRQIENSSEPQWEYSGGVDLVLINAWLPAQGDPTIDWASTISGQVSDRVAAIQTLTLGNVVERITRDLLTAAEDSSYGVGEVTDEPRSPVGHVGRDFVVQALSGVAAALGAKALGG